MSSHHFVKEGQEPALLIIDPIYDKSVLALLEWAPYVAVSAGALDEVLSWGIKIDLILTPHEIQEQIQEKVSMQMPVKFLAHEHFANVATVGIKQLSSHQNAVNVLAKGSDEMFNVLETFVDEINIALVDERTRWIPTRNFDKWLPSKTVLSIRKGSNQMINKKGLIEISPDKFESIADGNVSLQSQQIFWVGESI